jgi:hypothetical protein
MLIVKEGVTEEKLRAIINKGTGNNMLKKAKLVVSVIRIYWKRMEESTPGKGYGFGKFLYRRK